MAVMPAMRGSARRRVSSCHAAECSRCPCTASRAKRPRASPLSRALPKIVMRRSAPAPSGDMLQEVLEARVLRIDEKLMGHAVDGYLAALHEDQPGSDMAREGHLVGNHDHGHAFL